MAKSAERSRQESDPLKMYTLVMALLVVVMAVLYFVIDGTRKDYLAANKWLKGQLRYSYETRDPEIDGPPSTIPDLAWEVESLSHTYKDALSGGGLESGIPSEMMKRVAMAAHLKQVYSSGERREPKKDYETITSSYEYESELGGAPEVWRILTLLWNIESRGRYRVNEVKWDAADPTDNPKPPFDKVKKPRVRVALRVPTVEKRGN